LDALYRGTRTAATIYQKLAGLSSSPRATGTTA
jgi:hypothetical protein